MSQRRLKVGVIFGGRSGEHEVSVMSARGILKALDPERFEPVAIGIDRQGRWQRIEAAALLGAGQAGSERVGEGALIAVGEGARIPAGEGLAGALERREPTELGERFGVDVFFPIVHGTQGEDGALQGLLEMAGAPYVGCGVLGSALGMDKDVSKRLLRDAGLPVVDFIVARAGGGEAGLAGLAERVAAELGYPCFVKPANLGSSVGISKVRSAAELPGALEQAFRYDRKLVIERGISAREIETAVLGLEQPEVSVPGEIVPKHEFYSYEAKYLDPQGAELVVPARLSEAQTRQVQQLSLRVFEVLELEGLARVDFFLDRDTGAWFVNEVNTLPGFTEVSMYARMWQQSGLSYRDLVTRLIELALARHAGRRALDTQR